MLLIISCYIADLIFGDPEWFPHPVRGMGKLIGLLDKRLRRGSLAGIERTKGAMLAFIVTGISASLAYLFIEFSKKLNPFLGSLAWIYLGYTTLSIKDLQVKAKAILKEIESGSIIGARTRLSEIVGRDTQNLSKDRIIVATIESVAENINDGIIAPLFYLILGGPVLAVAYKSINTLDSMVGYKNEKYIHFGWFPARLDDVFNFIPARISGFLISISSFIIGKGFTGSFKTMLRDGKKHPSPNSGISEAAMAGALGIRLGGIWSYQGKFSAKPYLGKRKRVPQPFFISNALTISLISSILMVFTGVVLKWLI
ncbi:MAG: cobalamin biosynthesis protein CobD [Candidatus Omnitrophota bacterium]|nr:MAG: cobalamin biosynthesis protein CobD [Candidatus Omnitrophota bacterium]